jgi:hypothetical protein
MKTATKTFYLFVLTFLTLALPGMVFSQSDLKYAKTVNSDTENITVEEMQAEGQIEKTERNIPGSLLDQLETVKSNGGDVTQIQAQIDSYNAGVQVLGNQSSDIKPLGKETGVIRDSWMTDDIMIHQGTTTNLQRRTLDMKYGPDGNVYVAMVHNGANSYIRVYKSTDKGMTWEMVGGASTTGIFGTISMLVENRDDATTDSVRAVVYYTRAADNSFDNARVGFFSIRTNTATTAFVGELFLDPAAGNELNYVSAVSDGQFYDNNTYFGVVVGEYNNAGTECISLRYARTTNWGTSHTAVTLNTPYEDYFPSAAFKPESTSDSVYIAVERRLTAGREIRILKTPFLPTATFTTNFLTSDSLDYRYPVISIQQTAQNLAKRIVITSTKQQRAVYHYSNNDGGTWSIDATLDTDNSQTTNFTWITSDTTTAGGGYFMAIFAEGDSINVRRGIPGSMGVMLAKQNSNMLTNTAFPVCAIINDNGTKSSAFAYWGTGPENIYFDAEALSVGINNISEIAENYELKQNYPNPFNPTTNINFSIPKAGMVKLKVFDITGKEVATLVSQHMNAGTYNADFNGAKLSSGAYFYRLETEGFVETRKMLLVK